MNRKDHWENVYKVKSPLEVSWYQSKPLISLAIINSLPLERNGNLIDVGGGASTLVDCLLDEGFNNITVLDLSSIALDKARERLGNRSNLVTWESEDVTNFFPEKTYSLWHDRAVFHFLTEKCDREKYKACMESSVKVGGHLIIAAFSVGGPTKCSGLDIVQYDSGKIQAELGHNFKLIDEKSETHFTPAGKEQLFSYFIFQKIA